MPNHYSAEAHTKLIFYIKLGLLLFWGAWFFVAFLTNLFDYLYALHSLPPDWLFRSGNYDALAKVLNLHHTPGFMLNTLFILDTTAQCLASIFFFLASLSFWRTKQIQLSAYIAFAISMALWAVFLVMEEIFIAYGYEATHIRLFMFELITLMFLYLLPHHYSKHVQS